LLWCCFTVYYARPARRVRVDTPRVIWSATLLTHWDIVMGETTIYVLLNLQSTFCLHLSRNQPTVYKIGTVRATVARLREVM